MLKRRGFNLLTSIGIVSILLVISTPRLWVYLLPVWFVFLAGAAVSQSRQMRSLPRELDERTQIGPYLEALSSQFRNVRETAGDALVRLLPIVDAEEYHSLTALQRRGLSLAIGTGGRDLVLSALSVITRMQDESMATAVERRIAATNNNAPDQEVIYAARQCIAILQAKMSREHISATSIRPIASSDPPRPDTLLRASPSPAVGPPHLDNPNERSAR